MTDTLNIAQKLIEIESVSDNFENLYEIVDFVSNTFSEYSNAHIDIYKRNKYKSIVIQNFEGKNADYILLGHLDVVSPSEDGQFEPYINEGKLWGRGAFDMKGACAAMICIMQELLSQNYVDKKISLILTTDEEISGNDGTGFLVDKGYSAKLVIVPDGGSFDKVVIKQKGIFRFKIETFGKSTHGSTPWEGNNAIESIFTFYEELKSWITQKDIDEKKWFSTISMNNINTPNGTINKVPDFAVANFDCRMTQNITLDEIEQKTTELAKKYNGTMNIIYKGNPLFTSEKSVYANKYLNFLNEEYSINAVFDVEHSGCDGNFFSAKGIDVVVHRPIGGNIHGKDEWIDIQSLEEYRNFLYKFIIFS